MLNSIALLDFDVICFQDLLISVLSTVLVPSRTEHSKDISDKVLSGVIYESAMVGDQYVWSHM